MDPAHAPRKRLGILGALTLVPALAAAFLFEGGDGGDGDGGDGGDPGGAGGDGGEPPEPFDEERAMRTIRQQRESEAAAKAEAKEAKEQVTTLQSQLTEMQAELAKLKSGDKSDVDKLTDQVADLQKQLDEAKGEVSKRDDDLRKLTTHKAFVPLAEKAKAIDTEAVWALLDLSKVRYADDGTPENLETLIEGIQERHPKQFETGKPKGNGDGGTRPGGDGEDVKPGKERLQKAFESSGS